MQDAKLLVRDIARQLMGPVSRSFDHVIRKPTHRRLSLRPAPARLHFRVPLQEATPDNGCMQ